MDHAVVLLDAGLRLHVDEGVAQIAEEAGQAEDVLAQIAGLEDFALLDLDRAQGLILAARILADDADLADGVLLALVYADRDVDALVLALDPGLVHLHVDVAVVVVEGGDPVGIGLERLAVQRAARKEHRQQRLLARLHDALQPGVGERLVALEIHRNDVGGFLFLDRERDGSFAGADLLGAIRNLCVEIAFLFVGFLGVFDAAADADRVENGPRMNLEGDFQFLLADLVVALEAHLADQRALAHPIRQNGAPILAFHTRLHVVEEAHFVDGADVGVHRFGVERGAGQHLGLDADRFFLDPVVAADHYLIDDLRVVIDSGLRSRFGRRVVRIRGLHIRLGGFVYRGVDELDRRATLTRGVFNSLAVTGRLGLSVLNRDRIRVHDLVGFEAVVEQVFGDDVFGEFLVLRAGVGRESDPQGAREQAAGQQKRESHGSPNQG